MSRGESKPPFTFDTQMNMYTFDASKLVELNPLGFKTMQDGDFLQGQRFESDKTEVLIGQANQGPEPKTSEYTENERKPYADFESTIVNSMLESGRQSPIKSVSGVPSRNTNYAGKLPPLT